MYKRRDNGHFIGKVRPFWLRAIFLQISDFQFKWTACDLIIAYYLLMARFEEHEFVLKEWTAKSKSVVLCLSFVYHHCNFMEVNRGSIAWNIFSLSQPSSCWVFVGNNLGAQSSAWGKIYMFSCTLAKMPNSVTMSIQKSSDIYILIYIKSKP